MNKYRIAKIVIAVLLSFPVLIASAINTDECSIDASDKVTTTTITTTTPTTTMPITTTTPTTTPTPTTTTSITTTKPETTTEPTTTTIIPDEPESVPESTEEEPINLYYDQNLFNQRRSDDNWLFVGDSRFMFWYNWGLYGHYIAESGQGLNMIYDNYDEIMSYRDYNIVFNLGANQWWSGWEYVNLLNSFPDEFTQNNHIIVMPLNPTDGRFDWMNEKFDSYNQILRDNLRDDYEYFDTATWMKDVGYSTADGLHYTTNQDYITYNFLMNGE